MVGIAVFVVVLAVVFALKALSIVRMADDAIVKSTAFSWLAPKAQDAQDATAAAAAQAPEAKRSAQVHVFRRRPHAA